MTKIKLLANIILNSLIDIKMKLYFPITIFFIIIANIFSLTQNYINRE